MASSADESIILSLLLALLLPVSPPPISSLSPMATKGCQAQGPPMTPAAERPGGGRVKTLPPPRRGQIKEQIIKDFAAAVSRVVAGLSRSDKNGGGGGGVPVADDDDYK